MSGKSEAADCQASGLYGFTRSSTCSHNHFKRRTRTRAGGFDDSQLSDHDYDYDYDEDDDDDDDRLIEQNYAIMKALIAHHLEEAARIKEAENNKKKKK